MSEDPIGFKGGDYNLYNYVSNRPIIAKDPNGKSKLFAALFMLGIALGIKKCGAEKVLKKAEQDFDKEATGEQPKNDPRPEDPSPEEKNE